jgi:1-deoxy-D-xylulose-5-phosphate synthase
VVELAIALHRSFESPKDAIIWDVSHQCYAHKLLTGRCGQFSTIRTFGGMSGFTNRSESEHDFFDCGHASTSVSSALGLSVARRLRGEDGKVIAVLGDGALTGGMAEGMTGAYTDRDALVTALKRLVKPGDVLLFKGSHGMHMEIALEKFLKDET